MAKIVIDVKKKGAPQASNFLPLLEYLAGKNIHPQNGSLENMDIFSQSHNGTVCVMSGKPDYQEIAELFEFHKWVEIDPCQGVIYDGFSGIEFIMAGKK